MKSNNPVKALGWMLHFIHIYDIQQSCKGSWLDVVFHTYMTIRYYKYFLTKYNPLKK